MQILTIYLWPSQIQQSFFLARSQEMDDCKLALDEEEELKFGYILR